jgi:uncharacterized protein YbjQ (UPF0145 family)
MAICSLCEKRLGLLDAGVDGLCTKCHTLRTLDEIQRNMTPEEQEAVERKINQDAEIEAVMLTTEAYPQGLTITRRIEVVTAECAFGMNIFKDLFAGVRDIVGGRSEAVQKTMRDSRRVALHELKKEAHAVGANAVVGVDLDYVELNAGVMVLLVASGTAVVIEGS